MSLQAPVRDELPEGAIIDGRYRIVRTLGSGGMGVVYEVARDDGTKWALKTLFVTIGAKSKAKSRFLREAKISSSIASPHVLHAHECGIDEATATPFIVMDLLAGEDLERTIDRVGALSPQIAVRVALQAGAGLRLAHAQGVVHRDIKPSNLLLHEVGGELQVKVADFGVAKAFDADEALTATGSSLGSPMYMAPEQLSDAKRADARADVWGLGMVLYEALAGVPAIRNVTSLPDIIMAVRVHDIPPLQEAAPWIEPGLAAAVHAALLRDLDARCPTIEALLDAIRPYAGGTETIPAGAPLGVDEGVRSQVQPRAERPRSWTAFAGTIDATSSGPENDPMIGKTLAGKYRLVRVLGRGGMGAVYEAETPAGDHVAVKVVLEETARRSKDAQKRFVRETRAAMSVTHDHVVRVLDADTDGVTGVPFLVMELLRGEDLSSFIKTGGPLDPASACRVFVEACEGLAAAHALGLVHRDIKPANIFLHELEPGRLCVKICDFGVAKQVVSEEIDPTGTDLTRTGGMIGSPVYMSPEQARNAKQVDPRSDVWSLAMSLHEALSGKKPWAEFPTVGELILAICTRDPTPLQDLAPWIEPALAKVVHSGLRRDPSERFSSATDLAQALKPFALRKGDPLTRERLTSLPPEKRSQVAARADYPSQAAWQSSVGGSNPTMGSSGSRPPPRSRALAVVGVGVFLAAGAAAFALGRRDAQPAALPAAPAAPPSTSSAAPSTHLRVSVPISPADAKVTVAGQARPVVEGAIILEGEPGDVVDVVVESADGRAQTSVTLRRDGTAAPASIAVATAPKPVASAAKPAAATPARNKAPSVAAPAAAPPAKPADPGGLHPNQEWR